MSELDDMVLKARFEEIKDARKRLMEKKADIEDYRIMGRISEKKAALMYRNRLKSYVLELQNLIRNAEDVDEDYWESVEIGKIKLPNGKVEQIQGLKSILEYPEVWTVAYEREVENARSGKATETAHTEVWIPIDVLDKALRACEEFCNDFGLELDKDDVEDHPWGFREIVDEDEQSFDPQRGPVDAQGGEV